MEENTYRDSVLSEWNKLTPRERDFWMADLLGWTEIDPLMRGVFGGCGCGVRPRETRKSAEGKLLMSLIPRYSTNDSAALEIIQELKKEAFLLIESNTKGEFYCMFSIFDESVSGDMSEDTQNFAEAVCQAGILFKAWEREG